MVIRLVTAVVLVATPATAQTRPSSAAMTCREAARLIQARGALVLGTGGMTYDRFVRDRSFCEPTEIARRAFRPTRDNPNCLIGCICYEAGPGDRPGEDF